MRAAQSMALLEQEIIRIYITNAPGNGDQSATRDLLISLVKQGFKGTFEVIYALGAVAKIKNLFNLPFEFSAQSPFHALGLKAIFVSASYYIKHLHRC